MIDALSNILFYILYIGLSVLIILVIALLIKFSGVYEPFRIYSVIAKNLVLNSNKMLLKKCLAVFFLLCIVHQAAAVKTHLRCAGGSCTQNADEQLDTILRNSEVLAEGLKEHGQDVELCQQ